MISNIEIRQRTRNILGYNLFGESWLYPVLVALIVSAINSALSSTKVGPLLVLGLVSIATASYHLGRVRGQTPPGDIMATVEGIKRNGTNGLIAGILYTLFVALATVLLVIPGVILSISYGMVFYILNDNPGMSAMDALKESQRLMKGHKWQFFCLCLSFIGWAIVGVLCLGIGTLWVTAYIETSCAIFYEELLANDREYFNSTGSTDEDKRNNSTSW